MPCTVTTRSERLWREAEKVTQLLCGLCQYLEENKIKLPDVKTEKHRDWPNDNITLKQWWKKHKNMDKKKKDEESRKMLYGGQDL